jgi:hypothetical protein
VKVLVCGGRSYSSSDAFNWLERNLRDEVAFALGVNVWTLTHIIEGGARGADEGARRWGDSEGVTVMTFPADWKRDGKAAGPIRNAKMLREGKPDVVVAFPGGRGTANMTMQAEGARIPVIRVTDEMP